MATAIPFAQKLKRVTVADLTQEEICNALAVWLRGPGLREVASIRSDGSLVFTCTLSDGGHRFTGRGRYVEDAIANALESAGAFE